MEAQTAQAKQPEEESNDRSGNGGNPNVHKRYSLTPILHGHPQRWTQGDIRQYGQNKNGMHSSADGYDDLLEQGLGR